MINENTQFKKFSLAICIYKLDNALHFEQALNSIMEQTYVPSEIVIIVDGPIPKALNKIVVEYDAKDICKVIRLHSNVGHGLARKRSIEECTNEIIALMDADDISVPTRFEHQIKVLENDDSISVVGGNILEFIGDLNNIIGKRNVPTDHEDIVDFMKRRCPLNQVTVMFRKIDVISSGNYIDFHYEEDYYLWVRMMLKGYRFKNLNIPLVYVRIGKEMYQRRGGLKYFISEYKLQKFMLVKKIISPVIFIENVVIRFIVQVLFPIKLRAFFYKRYARD